MSLLTLGLGPTSGLVGFGFGLQGAVAPPPLSPPSLRISGGIGGRALEPPRLVPREGRIFSIVGEAHIKFTGSSAVVLIRSEVKTLMVEQFENGDDEEILIILDD